MIKSYRNRHTARFAAGERVKEFEHFASQARRRLAILNMAGSLKELAALRGNGLEALKDDRAGQHSIRINKQWRICFIWI
jgi:proteic killer suppression protein